ncbi:MAG: zinc dependent phospholipase C family protein [Bacteroidota bacterium]
MIKKIVLCGFLNALILNCHAWGFYGHRQVNYYAIFLLPPEMLVLYKPHLDFLTEHAVDPDKRRYAVKGEAPRHYIDLDRYGVFPWDSLPRGWNAAIEKYSEDSLQSYGIVPWWVQVMERRLTEAFKAKDQTRILKLSAEIGHYIADAHVPLHATQNHNGQFSNQHGIHGFWESRLPELFAESSYDFLLGRAAYIDKPGDFIWARVIESGAAADTVLKTEAALNTVFPSDQKFAFEDRMGKITRQYSTAYSKAYQNKLKGMVERRMRQSIFAVASFWFTAWVNAGQPDLKTLVNKVVTAADQKEWESLDSSWQAGKVLGKDIEEKP